MLDDFKDQQPVVYTMMKNAVSSGKLSHAYLLDIKNYFLGNEMAMAFVKSLLCPMNYRNKQACSNCSQCEKIDNSNYTELKIIHPDGLWIKKEQMDELQEEFSKKALAGKYKVYVIFQAEKLNKYAANSLLKFLEEPEEGIIAILITNNFFQVLETIRSRCQILSFSNEKNNNNDTSMIESLIKSLNINLYDINTADGKEKLYRFIENVLYFIDIVEKRGKDSLLYTEKAWHKNISEKEELMLAFDLMIVFYSDILNIKSERKLKFFAEKIDFVSKISEENSIEKIVNKISVLSELKGKIKLNINNKLLIDTLIMNFGGE